jgi:hypothetical protein
MIGQLVTDASSCHCVQLKSNNESQEARSKDGLTPIVSKVTRDSRVNITVSRRTLLH